MFKRLYHTEDATDKDNQKHNSAENDKTNNNRWMTFKSQKNLLTLPRNEEQKVMPKSNSTSSPVVQNLNLRRMGIIQSNKYPSHKETIDESWAFDGTEQMSAIGMNLQDINENEHSIPNHSDKAASQMSHSDKQDDVTDLK